MVVPLTPSNLKQLLPLRGWKPFYGIAKRCAAHPGPVTKEPGLQPGAIGLAGLSQEPACAFLNEVFVFIQQSLTHAIRGVQTLPTGGMLDEGDGSAAARPRIGGLGSTEKARQHLGVPVQDMADHVGTECIR